jgi:hypothetical protein
LGYLHVDNLYKDKQILQFKRVYALEKVHGTSAHIKWFAGALTFFSGGEKHDRFVALFNQEELVSKLTDTFGWTHDAVVIYGEAYGGKQQGMSKTYGPDLKFVAFDVKVGDCWLQVEQAARLVTQLGLEFVDYEQIDATIEEIDRCRDLPSTQAARNGVADAHLTIREGVVLRPVFEVTLNNGRRLIAKHKRDEFRETKSVVKLDSHDGEKKMRAGLIAEEWCTPMRFEHVVDQLIREREDKQVGMQDIPALIKLMREDILREGADVMPTIEDVKAFDKTISFLVVKFLKARLNEELRERN